MYQTTASWYSVNRLPHPVHGAEVNSFSKVETLVESTVVSSGESDDELACTLVGAVDLQISRKREIYDLVRCEINLSTVSDYKTVLCGDFCLFYSSK